MSALPFRAFQKSSLYIRCAIVTLLLAMLSTSFAVPGMIHQLPERPWLKLVPPVWFISLNQSMLGSGDAASDRSVVERFWPTGVVVLLGIAAYGFSYRRCFALGAESATGPSKGDGVIARTVFRLLDRLVFCSAFERASYRFTVKALVRGESQALVLGWFGGLGIVIAAQTLVGALNVQANAGDPVPSAALLSIPLTLGYFLISECGARLRFPWLRARTGCSA